MKNTLLKLLAGLLTGLVLQGAQAESGGFPLDHFPTDKLTEEASLQNGAKLFVNYCLNCHSANLMRYNRLKDIGLTDDQIRKNLLFTADKVGETMKTSLSAKDAKEWFGALPPDLSVIARARASSHGSGADWLYTYLRGYYRDASRPTGWNNAVFENVGMPHVFWELQGSRGASIEEVRAVKDEKSGAVTGWNRIVTTYDTSGQRSEKTDKLEPGYHHAAKTLTLGKAEGGKLTQAQYDSEIADLVAYITYMSDPSAKARVRIGAWVLIFLSLFALVAWNLNRVYWKDVK